MAQFKRKEQGNHFLSFLPTYNGRWSVIVSLLFGTFNGLFHLTFLYVISVAAPCEDDHNVHVICKRLSALEDDLEDVISKELPLTNNRTTGAGSFARAQMLRITEAELGTIGVIQIADELQPQTHRPRSHIYHGKCVMDHTPARTVMSPNMAN